MFSKEDLAVALGKKLRTTTNSIEHPDGFGSRFDARKLRDDDNGWVLYCANDASKAEKILISVSLNLYPQEEIEMQFLDSLLEHGYLIYLWQGHLIGPIADRATLRQQMEKIQPASTEEIGRVLSDQEQSIHDFEVLDQERYEEVVAKLAEIGDFVTPLFGRGMDLIKRTALIRKKETSGISIVHEETEVKYTKLIDPRYVDHIVQFIDSDSSVIFDGVYIYDVGIKSVLADFYSYRMAGNSEEELKAKEYVKILLHNLIYLRSGHIGLMKLKSIEEGINKFAKETRLGHISDYLTHDAFIELFISDIVIISYCPKLNLPTLCCKRLYISDAKAEITDSTLNLQDATIESIAIYAKRLDQSFLLPKTCERFAVDLIDPVDSLDFSATRLRSLSISCASKIDFSKVKLPTTLQALRVKNVEKLNLPMGLRRIKIEATNLEGMSLDFSATKLESITLKKCSNLDLAKLKLPPTCKELRLISNDYLQLKSYHLDLSAISLYTIVISDDMHPRGVQRFEITPSQSCRQLELANCRFKSANQHLPNLEYLTVADFQNFNMLLDLSLFPSLRSLTASNTSLTDSKMMHSKLESIRVSVAGQLPTEVKVEIDISKHQVLKILNYAGANIIISNFDEKKFEVSRNLLPHASTSTGTGTQPIRGLKTLNSNSELSSVSSSFSPAWAIAGGVVGAVGIVTTFPLVLGMAGVAGVAGMIGMLYKNDKNIDDEEENYGSFLYKKGVKQRLLDYRISILDRISEDGVFSSEILETDLVEVSIAISKLTNNAFAVEMENHEDDDEHFVGIKSVAHSSGDNKWHPISSLTPCSMNSLCMVYSNVDGVQIKWHKHHQQYYYCLPNIRQNVNLQLLYVIAADKKKEEQEIEYIYQDPNKLLPPKLMAEFREIARRKSGLAFLFNEHLPIDDRLHALSKFFRKFNDIDSSNIEPQGFMSPLRSLFAAPTGGVDALKKCLEFNMGACRERAMLYVICARLIGVETDYIRNEEHAFVQCRCKINGEQGVVVYDLGGSDPAPKVAQDFTLSGIASFVGRSNVVCNEGATYTNVTIDLKGKRIIFTTRPLSKGAANPISEIACGYRSLCISKTDIFHSEVITGILNVDPNAEVKTEDILCLLEKYLERETTGIQPPLTEGKPSLNCIELLRGGELYGLSNELYNQCILMIILHYYGIAARLKIDGSSDEVVIQLPIKTVNVLSDKNDESIDWISLEKLMEWHKKTHGAVPQLREVDALEELSLNPGEYFSQHRMATVIRKFNDLYARKNPLIVTKNPLSENSLILEEYKKQGGNVVQQHVFINSPRDFKILFASKTTDEPGPLSRIIKQGGIVVINWSNFTPNKIAYYSSILDKEPTLSGEEIASGVLGISLMQATTEASGAFGSRCSKVCLRIPQENPGESADLEQGGELKETIKINLYGSDDWKDRLLGKPSFEKEGRMVLGESLLDKAIREGRDIEVINKPEDPEFDDCVYRINEEQKYYADGRMILTATTKIRILDETREEYKHPSNVAVERLSQGEICPVNVKKYYLNNPTYYQFLEKLKVNNASHEAEYVKGVLDKYKEGEIIYVTESLSKLIWQRLMDEIQKEYPDKQFKFVLAPEVEIEGVIKNEEAREKHAKEAGVYVSNDPDFCAERLHATKPESIIIPITPWTNLGELIKLTEVGYRGGKYSFSRQKRALLNALSDRAKTIILNGQISPTLYQQLLKYIERGQVIVVISPETARKIRPLSSQARNYSWQEYADQYSREKNLSEEDRANFEKLKRFYALGMKMKHVGRSMPEELVLSYERIKMCLETLRDKSPQWHTQNQLKSIIHYDYEKNTEERAYLDVLSKLIFNSNADGVVRKEKLRKLLQENGIITMQGDNVISLNPSKIHQCRCCWQLLDCFGGKELVKIFTDAYANAHPMKKNEEKITMEKIEETIKFEQSPPGVSEAVLESLFEHAVMAVKLKSEPCTSVSQAKSSRDKAKEKLAYDLQHHKVVFFIGEAGAGKTHMVRELEDRYEIHNESRIEACLTPCSASGKPRILVLNEGNLKPDGYWDFLKGITTSSREILYKGKMYKVPEDLRIIVTGNPASYPGRNRHGFFQKCAIKYWIKPLNKQEIKEKILRPILGAGQFEEELDRILKICDEIAKYTAKTVSVRDIKSLAWRFKIFSDVNSTSTTLTLAETLYRLAVAEFCYEIEGIDKRQRFKMKIAEICGLQWPVRQSSSGKIRELKNKVIIPESHQEVVSIIEQDISLRGRPEAETKPITLLVGSSGLGKSTILRAILEEHGITKENSNAENRYYEITGKGRVAKEIIERAARDGSVVVVDEWNVNEIEQNISFEDFINNLLDNLGRENVSPKFRIFASQNRACDLGRSSASKADTNRVHYLYYEDYAKGTLIDIADYYLKDKSQAKAFVADFLKCKAEPVTAETNTINERNFHEALKKLAGTHGEQYEFTTPAIKV